MSDLTISTISTALSSGDISGDAKEWRDVEDKLRALLPNVSTEELTTALQDKLANNPGISPADALEQVVTELNPSVTAAEVSALRTEWEQFIDSTDLMSKYVSEVMDPPEDGQTGIKTVKDMMADLMMLMIEVFGEDAANSLLEGFGERDAIMALAKEKAAEMRAMAVTQLVLGLCSAATSIVGGIGGMKMAGGNAAKSQAFTMMMGGGAKVFDSFSQLATGLFQANIAELDGKSQAAQVRKETAQKLEDMARDLIKVFIDIYNNLASQEYQTLSKMV